MKQIRGLLIVLLILVLVAPTLTYPRHSLAQCGWGGGYICGKLEGGDYGGHFYYFFTPFGGTEWAVDPLLTDVSSGEQIDLEALNGKSLRIWMPEFDPSACDFPNMECLTRVAGYQVVPSCEPIVNFYVERGEISLGECTTLYWLVDNVSGFDGVTLDGECVDPEGSRLVCPIADTTYTLSLSPYFGEITKRIVVRVMVPTPTSLPPTATPTLTSQPAIASSSLEISAVQIEPSQVSVFELVRIKLSIENKGAPLNQPFWEYRGEIILESEDGKVIERHSFARGDASFISPIVESGQVNFEKWLLTVKVRFGTAVSNGRVIVRLQPNIEQQSELRGEGRLTINPGLSGLTCTSVIVNKLVGPFSSDTGKDLLDAITAELQAVRCEDGDVACAVPPLVKGFMKILGRDILGAIGKIITGIWGVFDTNALQACGNPVNWMWQLVREFNRQGVRISVSGVHSPMTILVTNSAGQRAGFISEDEVVTEIPDSQVIEWEGDKYVIYPASPGIIVSLQATGSGTVDVSLIDGQSGREISYTNVSVYDGDKARIDLSDPQNRLVIDVNDDANPDETYYPEATEMLRASETPTASPPVTNPPRGICGGSIGLITLPFIIALILVRFHKPGKS